MKAIVQEWGNGLGFRIPAHWAKEYDIKNGSKVEIIIEKARVVILPKKEIS